MYLGCRFLPIRVRGIFSYPTGKKWISSFSMYLLTVKVGHHVHRQFMCNELVRSHHYRTHNCLPPKKLCRDIQ